MKLSVIIPVHDGARVLERCLAALQRSSFRDYECIVVDDASTDGTRAIAARFPVTLVALEQRGGPARARNHGAARSLGEILVFLDSDVCVHPATLGLLHEHLAREARTSAVFGSYDDTPADTHFVSQYKNLAHHYVHQRSRSDAWTFWAGCGAIRREAFLEVGGFDESYSRPSVEDIALGLRLRARGLTIDLDREIQVTHLKRWTAFGLARADLFDRAIPWLLLMMRHRTMPSDLNVTHRDRLSVAAACAIPVLLATAGFALSSTQRGLVAALVLVCVGSLVALNLDLYRFFAERRGLGFALRSAPLHWFYLMIYGLAVPMALIAYALDLDESRSAAVRSEDA